MYFQQFLRLHAAIQSVAIETIVGWQRHGSNWGIHQLASFIRTVRYRYRNQENPTLNRSQNSRNEFIVIENAFCHICKQLCTLDIKWYSRSSIVRFLYYIILYWAGPINFSLSNTFANCWLTVLNIIARCIDDLDSELINNLLIQRSKAKQMLSRSTQDRGNNWSCNSVTP
jgi:hypothetical protein